MMFKIQIWVDGWRDYVTGIKTEADAERIITGLRGLFISGLKFQIAQG